MLIMLQSQIKRRGYNKAGTDGEDTAGRRVVGVEGFSMGSGKPEGGQG